MSEEIEAFLEKMKNSKSGLELLDKLKSKRFSLVYLILATEFKKNTKVILVPIHLFREFSTKVDKRTFLECVSLMQDMGYLYRIPGTGNSMINPIKIKMLNMDFIAKDHFDAAKRVLEAG